MRRRLRPELWLPAVLVAALISGAYLGGCAGTIGEDSPKAAARSASGTVDDIAVYFRVASIESLSDQALPKYPETDPGESSRVARDFPDAPPQIPHAVDDMYPITLGANECLDCHSPENAIGVDDVPLPESHLVAPVMGAGAAGDPMVWVVMDYRKTEGVTGARYNCNMCHTPQATNVFTPRNLFDSPRNVK